MKKEIAEGAFGKVYNVEDMNDKLSEQTVIKISSDYKIMVQEAKILYRLKALKEKSTDMTRIGFPTPLAHGVFIGENIDKDEFSKDKSMSKYKGENSNIYGFIIMPKYMFPLNHVQDILEPFETFKIMKDVFGALENLHLVGYVHNDLKPSNIMID